MIGVGAKKMLYNRFVADGQLLLGISEDLSNQLIEKITKLPTLSLTDTLSKVRLVAVDCRGQVQRDRYECLIGENEQILASCLEDNYYTFATSNEAAERMYSDHVPIKELRQLILNQPEDPKVLDLTLIKGDRLWWSPDIEMKVSTSVSTEEMQQIAELKTTNLSKSIEQFMEDLSESAIPKSYIDLNYSNILECLGDSARPIIS